MSFHKLFTDGTHSPEFNIAGIGGFIEKENVTVLSFSEKLIEDKYFVYHEHMAIIHGLKKALELNVSKIKVFSDFKFYSKYLNGDLDALLNYSANKINLKENQLKLLTEIVELIKKFDCVFFTYVPRNENKKAHKLADKVYKKIREKIKRKKRRKLKRVKLVE